MDTTETGGTEVAFPERALAPEQADDLPEVDLDEYLDGLASRVRDEQQALGGAAHLVVDSYLAIGRCLSEARDALPSDQAYGAWFQTQEFGFTIRWGHTLRQAAEHEQAVRAVVGSQLLTGGANIAKAVAQVTGGTSRRSPDTTRRSDFYFDYKVMKGGNRVAAAMTMQLVDVAFAPSDQLRPDVDPELAGKLLEATAESMKRIAGFRRHLQKIAEGKG